MEVDAARRLVSSPTSDDYAASVLSGSELFSSLTRAAKVALARHAERVMVERRQHLYRQDEAGGSVYVLAEGRVRLVRRGRGDREITVAYRTPGQLVGEDVLAGIAHRHDARVTERVEGVVLPAAAVRAVAEEDSALALALHDLELERRLEMEARIEALLTRPVESRVAEFLCVSAARHGVPEPRGVLIGIKVTHQEIASFVGSTRETVTLILGDLKRRGLILTDHRRLVVTDLEKLEQLA